MQRELVSVVIPVYNAESFIKNAITSIYNQSYRPIEIIVVNDGSTDQTLNVVETLKTSIIDKGIFIKIVSLEENRGAANALNTGFKEARGNYICWLSADDVFINPKKIEKQVLIMKKNNTLWSYYERYYIGESIDKPILMGNSLKFKVFNRLALYNMDIWFLIILYLNPVNGSSLMFHRKCLENYGYFDPVLKNVDADGDMLLRLSLLKIKPSIVKDIGVFYTQHSSQTSKKIKEMTYGCDLTRVRILKLLEEEGILEELSKFILGAFLYIVYNKKKAHLAYPFTSEFLLNYIIRRKNNIGIRKLLETLLAEISDYIKYLGFDKEAFYRDVEEKSKSIVFEEFKKLLRERRKKYNDTGNRR